MLIQFLIKFEYYAGQFTYYLFLLCSFYTAAMVGIFVLFHIYNCGFLRKFEGPTALFNPSLLLFTRPQTPFFNMLKVYSQQLKESKAQNYGLQFKRAISGLRNLITDTKNILLKSKPVTVPGAASKKRGSPQSVSFTTRGHPSVFGALVVFPSPLKGPHPLARSRKNKGICPLLSQCKVQSQKLQAKEVQAQPCSPFKWFSPKLKSMLHPVASSTSSCDQPRDLLFLVIIILFQECITYFCPRTLYKASLVHSDRVSDLNHRKIEIRGQ